MLRGDRADFPGQLRAADGLDLVGVDLGAQAMVQAGLQDLTGLLHSKGVRFTEHIAEFGDALLLDGGHHLLTDQADILRAVLLVLCRDQVGAHKGGCHIHGVLFLQAADGTQLLQLVLQGQSVAAFGLAGGGTEPHHLIQGRGGLLGELLLSGLTGGVRGGLDAAAGVLDVQIALSMELHAKLILAPAAENQMGVGVHQSGGHQLPAGVHHLGTAHGRRRPRPHLGDLALGDQDPGVPQDLDLPLLRASAGAGAGGGGQHSDVGQQ